MLYHKPSSKSGNMYKIINNMIANLFVMVQKINYYNIKHI